MLNYSTLSRRNGSPVLQRSLSSGLNSLCNRLVCSKTKGLGVYRDVGPKPSRFRMAHSGEAGFAIRALDRSVPLVQRMRHRAEVVAPVVQGVAVDVIDLKPCVLQRAKSQNFPVHEQRNGLLGGDESAPNGIDTTSLVNNCAPPVPSNLGIIAVDYSGVSARKGNCDHSNNIIPDAERVKYCGGAR